VFKFCWIALFNMLECDNGMVYDNVLCCFACLNVWLIICEAIASYVKFCCCCELCYFRIACLVCWSYRHVVYIVLKPGSAQRVDLGPGWLGVGIGLSLWKIREVKNSGDLEGWPSQKPGCNSLTICFNQNDVILIYKKIRVDPGKTRDPGLQPGRPSDWV
jgi:hypothetical protein